MGIIYFCDRCNFKSDSKIGMLDFKVEKNWNDNRSYLPFAQYSICEKCGESLRKVLREWIKK